MSIQTQVIWEIPIDPSTTQDIITQSNQLIGEGKEIGDFIKTTGPGINQVSFIRTWIDEPTALMWIEFVQQYNPVSATILN